MADDALIPELKNNINNLAKIDVEKEIIRSFGLGDTFNFRHLNTEFNQAILLLLQIESFPDLSDVPEFLLTDVNGKIISFSQAVDSIRDFQPNKTSSSVIRDNHTTTFRSAFQNLITSIVPVLQIIYVAGITRGNGLIEKEKELESYMIIAKAEIDSKLSLLNSSFTEFNERNKDLGIVKYADVFRKEFKRYQENSNYWLASSILFLAGIIVWLAYLGSAELNDVTITKLNSNGVITYYIIQKVVTRILIVSALFYGLAFSVKAFRASKHSSIVNKHRQSALETFEAFVNASADQNTKNAVLLEATRTIFSHQTTGYDTNDKDAEVPNKIIEIIKPVG